MSASKPLRVDEERQHSPRCVTAPRPQRGCNTRAGIIRLFGNGQCRHQRDALLAATNWRRVSRLVAVKLELSIPR